MERPLPDSGFVPQSLINSNLDRAALAGAFARTGRVRVPGVLREDFADAVYRCLTTDVPWGLKYYDHAASGRAMSRTLSAAELARTPPARLHELSRAVTAQASSRFGYLYEAYDVLAARREGRDAGLLLQQFLAFLGTDELFSLVRELTADTEFNRVDCHACRYRPGHFLRQHPDTSPFEQRRLAYVFYFTRDWDADFGGLTCFFDEAGEISDAFVPEYNSLTLFSVPVMHCVTQVASFAPRPRLSITGWFTRYD